MNEETTETPVANTTDTQETEQKDVATLQNEVNQPKPKMKAKTNNQRKLLLKINLQLIRLQILLRKIKLKLI